MSAMGAASRTAAEAGAMSPSRAAAEALECELAAYESLASVFLNVPEAADVERLRAAFSQVKPQTLSEGLIVEFVAQNASRSNEDVLLDIARDRVRLVRGSGFDTVKAPYESLYAGAQQGSTIGSLNRFYGECGFRKLAEVHDTADQLGVELAFVAELLRRELGQLEEGDQLGATQTDAMVDSFMSQHLLRWAPAYAQAVSEGTESLYWKAIAALLTETLALRALPA